MLCCQAATEGGVVMDFQTLLRIIIAIIRWLFF
jgi:hypothetical protein